MSMALVAKGAQLMKDSGLHHRLASPSHSLQERIGMFLARLANFEWDPVEDGELKRRKMLMLLYLLRSPFFDVFTRRVVKGARRVVSPIPLVGCVAAKAVELLLGVQQYYSYTSGS